jgi:hypothetical protein
MLYSFLFCTLPILFLQFTNSLGIQRQIFLGKISLLYLHTDFVASHMTIHLSAITYSTVFYGHCIRSVTFQKMLFPRYWLGTVCVTHVLSRPERCLPVNSFLQDPRLFVGAANRLLLVASAFIDMKSGRHSLMGKMLLWRLCVYWLWLQTAQYYTPKWQI